MYKFVSFTNWVYYIIDSLPYFLEEIVDIFFTCMSVLSANNNNHLITILEPWWKYCKSSNAWSIVIVYFYWWKTGKYTEIMPLKMNENLKKHLCETKAKHFHIKVNKPNDNKIGPRVVWGRCCKWISPIGYWNSRVERMGISSSNLQPIHFFFTW